jgi:hypothetical protein
LRDLEGWKSVKMARDRAKNAYYTVGIPLDSDALRMLREDSAETGVSIPQLLAVRICDWYRCTREVKSIPSAHADPVGERAATGADGYSSANGNELRMRASAAAAAWGGDEGEEV